MKKWIRMIAFCLLLCIPAVVCAQTEFSDDYLMAYFADYSIEELLNLQEMIRAELLRRDYADENMVTYVLNINTDKFHSLSCKSVGQIKETNRVDYSGSREQLIMLGFEPCGNCHP